ncbi:acyltransferase family protein [Terriglobus sp.]|uniref:acyltransferase family protein n=1 Tax=Terriglobus sp. TaxID=1889013 RepID=UPI003AFFB490
MPQNITAHRPKQNSLQLLRVLAATMVVVHHTTLEIARRHATFPVWMEGRYGVDLFFVLSGYVMVYSSSRLEAATNGWLVFLQRRVARVVPLYWIVTTIVLLGQMWLVFEQRGPMHLARRAVDSYLFLPYTGSGGDWLPLLGVGWTLVFEMFFYIVFAVALLLRANVLWFVSLFLGVVAAGMFHNFERFPALNVYCRPIVLEFVFGMVLARLPLASMRRTPWLACILLGGGLLLLVWPSQLSEYWRAVRMGLPAALVVYAALQLEPWFHRAPRFLLFLADATYSIYLVHLPLLPFLGRIGEVHQNRVLLTALCAGIVGVLILFGALIYYWFERPLLRWIQKHWRLEGKRPIQLPISNYS